MHERKHLLTVAVEDYFDATAIGGLVSERQKRRMEPRVEENTLRALSLLARFGQRATFFVLGRVADDHPELIKKIDAAGHEVACKGYQHRPLRDYDEGSFARDARASKRAVEDALGKRALGYRLSQGHLSSRQFWVLEALAEAGFVYDSSVYPRFLAPAHYRFPFEYQSRSGRLMEFPLSTLAFGSLHLPMGGGNYFRQLPALVPQLAFAHWHARYVSPYNLYFHVWELDEALPRIATADALRQLRQYRNVTAMAPLLEVFFSRYRFTSLAAFQRLTAPPAPSSDCQPEVTGARHRVPQLESFSADDEGEPEAVSTTVAEPLSVIVPCFNEADVLVYLQSALTELRRTLRKQYEISFILVDDCSSDDTWVLMQQRFARDSAYQLVKHEKNRGVAGAILTGIAQAKTELVCSIDADCTYEPAQLERLLSLLDEDTAMVTASPYHAQGEVVGVPAWRLLLSRNLSRMYGAMLHHNFATYTACFRAYRKSKVSHIRLQNTGFLGVAEFLVRLDLEGAKLAECPAVLEARLLGSSKLKTIRTIREHLRLLSRIPQMRKEAKPG